MIGKMNAIGLTLLMIASALAGCASGDPDGDGEMGIDADLLDQLIQDNLQDFINNTTVTVVNNHYSNDSNEVTNHINSSSVDSTLRIMTGAIEGYNLTSDLSSENDHVLLVRGDRYSYVGWNNMSQHNWSNINLNGANICVTIGSLEEGKLMNWFSFLGLGFSSVPVADVAEATAKFIDGSCDAMQGTRNQLELKKEQLESDGSMNGVEIWISEPMGQFGELYSVESRADFMIHQEYGIMIGFQSLYFEVSVEGTCQINCSSEDVPDLETFVFMSDGITFYSECEIPGHGLISEENIILPGLDCSMTFSLHAYIEFDNENYEYVWSDWAYYIAWTESEVTIE